MGHTVPSQQPSHGEPCKMRAGDAPAARMGQALNWLICFSWNLPCFFSRDAANAWISVGILSLERTRDPGAVMLLWG